MAIARTRAFAWGNAVSVVWASASPAARIPAIIMEAMRPRARESVGRPMRKLKYRAFMAATSCAATKVEHPRRYTRARPPASVLCRGHGSKGRDCARSGRVGGGLHEPDAGRAM